MKPDRWRQLSQLYHAALAREASERGTYLREACAGDEALQREVESLLTHGGTAEGFLARPALEAVANGTVEDGGPS